ncbi:gliding motility lipoprotein GldH [Flavobacterium rhizosphaerae]|uniref:Gliding motility lipoprotein GldH n=1 Tax=Flavobacterium rhizosphaerae TaxID=3163298 RepID=A0ABW8YYP2_9FLAO
MPVIIKNSLVAFIILLLCSCDRDMVFDEYKEVGSAWNKDSIVTFEFNRQDTLAHYNLFINIRNNNNYPYSNLFLIVQMQQPDTNITKVDTLEYEMANPDGTLMGSGFSDVKESKLWYKQNISFPKPGNYQVSIQQAVREPGDVPGVQELEGITEVGFRIESTQ